MTEQESKLLYSSLPVYAIREFMPAAMSTTGGHENKDRAMDIATGMAFGRVAGRMERYRRDALDGTFTVWAFDKIEGIPDKYYDAAVSAVWAAFRQGYLQAMHDADD